MDFELDPFDDIFSDNAVKNARPSGKFQPKAKPKPRKESSALVQSTRCTQSVIVSEPEINSASENCVDGIVVVPPPSDNRSSGLTNLSTEHLADKECKGSASGSCSEAILSGISKVCNSPSGKSEGEKGGIGSLLEVSNDFLSQTTTVTETQTTYVDTSRNEEIILGTVRDSRVDCGLRPCSTSGSRLAPELPTSFGPLTHRELTSNTDEYIRVENKMFEIEEGNISPCLEAQNITIEFTPSSGRKSGKLQPRPKLQYLEETRRATVPNPYVDPSVPSQTDNLDKGSLPTIPLDDTIDFSSMEFDDSIPTDPALEIPGYNEAENLVETSKSNDQNTVPDPTNHHIPSTSGQEVEQRRSSKRRRRQKHVHELVNEPEGSAVIEDDHTDKEYQLEDERQNKKVRGKSKKLVAENGKPVRKLKKANEVSDQSTKKSSKKFSHSTRRRGRLDMDLLKTPEDEIDISVLSIKHIILLGEHRELTAKKNPETSQKPVTNQSAAKSSARYYEDDDMFASEQGQESNDEQENVAVQDNGAYFNYHSHMKRTPRVRWTKQDTELFYEVLQQFGTDLTMITQFFPGRTRNQIKLKYKKEEREHPMRLHDAFTNRSKDHSYFELIVDRVKKAVAERKQNPDTDDLDGLSGEELEEVPPETNEATKSMQVEHMEDNVPAATGLVESSDSEDDEKRWSQFQSDL